MVTLVVLCFKIKKSTNLIDDILIMAEIVPHYHAVNWL